VICKHYTVFCKGLEQPQILVSEMSWNPSFMDTKNDLLQCLKSSEQQSTILACWEFLEHLWQLSTKMTEEAELTGLLRGLVLIPFRFLKAWPFPKLEGPQPNLNLFICLFVHSFIYFIVCLFVYQWQDLTMWPRLALNL
jgi:hypothetical protein